MINEPVPNFKTVDEYIDNQTDPAKALLIQLRQIIQTAVPEAVEGISYQMPVFKYHGVLAYFAAFKNHYSLFVTPAVRQLFNDRLHEFSTTKSAIHFRFDRPVPEKLITEIIGFAKDFNLKREARKATTPKQKPVTKK